MDFNQRAGARVKRYRRAAGMSQEQLASDLATLFGLPFHQQAIVKVETGRRPLRLEEAHAVAEILGVDLSLLIYDGHDEEKMDLETEVLELQDDIARLRSEISGKEKDAVHLEARLRHARERLRRLDHE
jgi:transcriptional regulator with XRE-family HTH domain